MRCDDAFRSTVGRRYARLVEEQGFLVFSELLVFGEMPVILGFEQAAWAHDLWSGLNQSASQLWPSISAGLFCSLED